MRVMCCVGEDKGFGFPSFLCGRLVGIICEGGEFFYGLRGWGLAMVVGFGIQNRQPALNLNRSTKRHPA